MTDAIRLATPTEAGAVAAVVYAAYAHYVERIGMRPAPMQADYAGLIARRQVHVVTDTARIKGVLVLAPQSDHLLLENVAVHPDHQGRGLGRQLMQFAEECARNAGLLEIRLYTHELMTENIRYYRRLGYEETERREENGFHRVFMRKRLIDPSK